MKKWEKQKKANILAFLTAPEFAERRELLANICREFENRKVGWAVSCSTSLFFKGLVDNFNDYDILINVNDVEVVEEILSKYGEINHATKQKACFASPYYKEMVSGGTHFDIIGNFTVCTFNTEYCYRITDSDIECVTLPTGVNIPIAPVEASLLLYGMMEGWQKKRQLKRVLCQEYLAQKGLEHPRVLKEALEEQELPTFLQKIVRDLL